MKHVKTRLVDAAKRALVSLFSAGPPPGYVELPPPCDHGVTFDPEQARGLSSAEIRTRWPRLYGDCPKGCGFVGIAYASTLHYVAGDW